MEAAKLIAEIFERNVMRLEEALEDLSDEDLLIQPEPHSNPIGWILWHATRTADLIAETISGETQVWLSDGWGEHIGPHIDSRDTGYGQTMEQVATLRASKADHLGYLHASRERVRACLAGLTFEGLAREVSHYRTGKKKIPYRAS